MDSITDARSVELDASSSGRTANSRFIPLLLSFCFVLSYDWYFFRDSMFGIGSMFNILMLGCIYRLICSGMSAEPRARRYGFAFSVLFSLALVIGRAMRDTNDVTALWNTPEAAAYALLSLLSFTAVFGLGSALALEAAGKIDDAPAVPQNTKTRPAFMFCAIWAFIFLCWLPVYLAYYPGVFAYDAKVQYFEAAGMIPFTRYHPPLHTFFLKICLMIVSLVIPWDPPDGLDAALCLYSISQMLILSAVFARAVIFFINRRLPRAVIIAALLFFSVNPVIALFSFNMTKDVLFGGAFLMLALELCELGSSPEQFFASFKHMTSFVIWALLSCLLRNNCIYALVLSVPIILVIIKGFRVKTLALCAVPMLCFMFINGPVYDAFGILYDALGMVSIHSRERLSVPIQQLARVAILRSNDISVDDKFAVNHFIPLWAASDYHPRFADPVKDYFKTEAYNNYTDEFWEFWADLGKRFPADYISAFLSLNFASWYSDAENIDKFTNQNFKGNSYISTDVILKTISLSGRPDPLERRSKIPALLPIYESIANFDALGSLPFVSQMFSISTPFWLMFACLVMLLYKGCVRGAIVLIPPIMLWATHLAGPVSYFRYVFPLFAAYPLFIALAMWPRRMLKHDPQNTD